MILAMSNKIVNKFSSYNFNQNYFFVDIRTWISIKQVFSYNLSCTFRSVGEKV